MTEPLIHWIHNRENIEDLDVATFTGKRHKVTCPHCLAVMSNAPDPDPVRAKPESLILKHLVDSACFRLHAQGQERGPIFVASDLTRVTCPECLKENMQRNLDRLKSQPCTLNGVRESLPMETRLAALEARVDALSQRQAQQDTFTRKF
jgi:hypothetical protein